MPYSPAKKDVIGYSIPDYGPDIIDCVEGYFFEDGEFWAQNAAEDFHSRHNGWESSWPLTFRLVKKDGTVIGDFEVDRDVQPVFLAREIKSPLSGLKPPPAYARQF